MTLATILRRIIGAPDYETYREHLRAHHPTEEPLTEEAFIRQRLEDRYSRPGSRCC